MSAVSSRPPSTGRYRCRRAWPCGWRGAGEPATVGCSTGYPSGRRLGSEDANEVAADGRRQMTHSDNSGNLILHGVTCEQWREGHQEPRLRVCSVGARVRSRSAGAKLVCACCGTSAPSRGQGVRAGGASRPSTLKKHDGRTGGPPAQPEDFSKFIVY